MTWDCCARLHRLEQAVTDVLDAEIGDDVVALRRMLADALSETAASAVRVEADEPSGTPRRKLQFNPGPLVTKALPRCRRCRRYAPGCTCGTLGPDYDDDPLSAAGGGSDGQCRETPEPGEGRTGLASSALHAPAALSGGTAAEPLSDTKEEP